MSEWDDDDDQFNSDSDLVKNLRKQLKAASDDKKALESELSTLRPQVRKNTVSGILSGLGLNPKLAGVLPESIEPNKESVQSWLDEYGELFNVAQTPPPAGPEEDKEGGPVNPANAPDTSIPQGMQAAWARMQGGDTVVGASPPDRENLEQSRLGDAAAKSNGNFDQFIALLRNEPLTPM